MTRHVQKIGLLRHRVEIQQATRTQDSYGDAIETWSTIATVWASVEPISGRELWQAQQAQADVTHTITIRVDSSTPILPEHRVKWGSRIFHVESALTIEEVGRFRVLTTKEQV